MVRAFSDCDLFVVDALREKPHPTHAHLAMTLELINAVKPAFSLITHMDNSMDYHRLQHILPKNVAPAYDGYEREV